MGEFRVHRVRFFEYIPHAIQCMVYNEDTQKLALSRSDGSLEIWSEKDDWYQEEVIPGREGQSVEDLVWQGSRLFSAGLDGNVNEIDLGKLQIKASSPSNAGPIWCLTGNSSQTKLAAGTEVGCVIIYDTTDGQLMYSTRFDSQESRILSISWHVSEDVIVTGGIDNIRLWSVKSGRAIQRLTLGRQRNKETVVWCVAVLSDMTIVSGDSLGKTTFWNGKQGTVIKSVQSHKADVYCITMNKEETKVVTAGVDPNVIQFNFVPARQNSDWKDWIGSPLHRQHTHDVRAVQMVKNGIVSGGVDTSLVFANFKSHRTERIFKKISPIPHKSLVKAARDCGVILLQYPTHLEVWRLGHTDRTGDNGDSLPLRSNPVKLIQLKTKSSEPVCCCDISQDATLLSYSDCDRVRIYRLVLENLDSIQPTVKMKKLSANPDQQPDSAQCMCFTSDSKKLVTVTSSRLQVVAIATDRFEIEFTIPLFSERCHLLTLSKDNRLAALADHSCNVHIYDIDQKQHLCNVPRYSCQATALSFSPDSSNLAIVYSDQKVYEFDILNQEYSQWCKASSSKFPKKWSKRPGRVTGVTYNPSHPDQLVLHDDQMFCILDKSQAFPDSESQHKMDKKHRTEDQSPLHISTKYKYLMHLDVLPGNWLVAVERPPLVLQSLLTTTLKIKKFGT